MANATDHVEDAGDAAGLDRLLSWFKSHGGRISKLCLEDLGGDMSLSVVTEEPVLKGDVVMSIPISVCMTVESVLALHLMSERRKGSDSFWKEYLSTLPDDVDTPLRWIVEAKAGSGEEEALHLLDGTMVGLLSKMMHTQVVKDWEEVHLPLIDAHPEVLGGIRFEDYLWAMSSIWSRAFDYLEQAPDGLALSRRAMVPVVNAANHDPSAAGSLSEMIEFHAEGGISTSVDRDVVGGGSVVGVGDGILRVVAGRDYKAREQFYLLYGRYSNAKLLYSYGFVLPGNPYGCLDYWIRIPPTDPGFDWKQALLDGHDLTATQAYDFSGTLRAGGWVSPALLATARVAQLNADERPYAENAFRGEIVSPRNEAAAMTALLAGLWRKLAGQSSFKPVDQTDVVIAKLEEQLSQRQQQQQEEQQQGQQQADGNASSRRIAATRVRLEEKEVVAGAVEALENSLKELQQAVSAEGVGLASFRPLDSSISCGSSSGR
eukprot:jgi/Undpi1/4333/HiC_scaffold_17.g07699.m1